MQTGRFFSLQKGRVGQYLSPRVLVVKTPFRSPPTSQELCYFGFETLNQAQKFAQHLASSGYHFQLRRSRTLLQMPYEVKLSGHAELAKTLAYWERQDCKRDRRVAESGTAAPHKPSRQKLAVSIAA